METWNKKDQDVVRYVIDENDADPAYIIPILRGVQAIYHYLPEPAMIEVAKLLDVSLTKVFGVALQCAEFDLLSPEQRIEEPRMVENKSVVRFW